MDTRSKPKPLSALRQARCEAVVSLLEREGKRAELDSLHETGKFNGLSVGEINRAVDDLAHSGRVQVSGGQGVVMVSLVSPSNN